MSWLTDPQIWISLLTLTLLVAGARGAAAQEAVAERVGPQVGDVAPDFTLTVAQPGYNSLVIPNFQITSDGCHVQSVSLAVHFSGGAILKR